MLVLFRSFFTGLFLYLLGQLSRSNQGTLDSDVNTAGWFAAAVIVGLAAACTWAPLIGSAVAGPITGMLTDGSVYETKDGSGRTILWATNRGRRRLAMFLCFCRGVWKPDPPTAFVIGLEQALAGSWWEKIFAREVWRFSNVNHCLRAYDLLRYRHHEDPGKHPHSEICLALISKLRERGPKHPPLAVPPAGPPPPLIRRKAIRLFAGAEAGARSKPTPK